jgi:hypothetical protein
MRIESEAAAGQVGSQAESVVEVGRLRLEVVEEADQVVLFVSRLEEAFRVQHRARAMIFQPRRRLEL